jgi:hypothetical protein
MPNIVSQVPLNRPPLLIASKSLIEIFGYCSLLKRLSLDIVNCAVLPQVYTYIQKGREQYQRTLFFTSSIDITSLSSSVKALPESPIRPVPTCYSLYYGISPSFFYTITGTGCGIKSNSLTI